MVGLDEFVIMPDHLHGIIVIHSRDLSNQIRTGDQIPLGTDESHFGAKASFPLMKNPKTTLGKIIRHFKAKATKLIHDEGFSAFRWQRNYYEQILRDEEHLDRVRAYILNNPLNWSIDRERSRPQ